MDVPVMWQEKLQLNQRIVTQGQLDQIALNSNGNPKVLEALYLPLLKHTLSLAGGYHSPLVVGITGPQGSGKSTLCHFLESALNELNIVTVSISVDDFYWTHTQQAEFASRHSELTYFQQRGYPGTHDIDLGTKTLSLLKNKTGEVPIPRYDKSAHGGLGERLQESEWNLVQLPVSVILFEGWMLGLRPSLQNSWMEIDEQLKSYSCWQEQITEEWLLYPNSFNNVYQWRAEAEEEMRRSTGRGLSNEAIYEYVEQFMPAYDTYYPELKDRLSNVQNSLVIDIGEDRLPIYCN